MGIVMKTREYMDNNPKMKPYLLMWLRKTTKTINEWPQEKLLKGVMDCYERRMGYRFDINKPRLFTEQLQWYKVFYHGVNFGKVTDKYLFKSYVKERLGEGYTIPYYGAWYLIQELEQAWETLPEEFVLKANLQSDGRTITIIHNKPSVDFKKLKKQIKPWLKMWHTLNNSWDCYFYNSKPCILAEEYMSNFENLLYDYKFFCFDGNQYCMYVAENDFGISQYPIIFYRLDWTRIDVQYGQHQTKKIPKLKHYEEMIKIAKVLSKGFLFVRVDFFDTEQKLYVAELTFAPGGGCTPYTPVSFNEKLGEMFKLPIKNQCNTNRGVNNHIFSFAA